MRRRLAHLPGLDGERQWRRIDGLEFDAPLLSGTEVRTVWGALATASRAWRAHPLAERLDRLAAIAARLRAEGPGFDADALAATTRLSPAGLRAAWDVTFAPCTRAALDAAIAAEQLWARLQAPGTEVGPVVHVVAGNVLPATWTMLVRGWLVGAPQWVRPAHREPLFAVLLAARLQAWAPELAATFAVAWWPHGDECVERHVLEAARVVTAQGDDASIAALAARTCTVGRQARFVGYESRWSAALVAPEAQTRRNAARLAGDIALFDQQGCLSPSVVLAADGARLDAWCGELAAELQAAEARLPRGSVDAMQGAGLRLWRESARLGMALGNVRQVWESAGSSAWAMVLTEPGTALASPLDRHVVVMPVGPDEGRQPESIDALRAAFGPRLARLQGLGFSSTGWSDEVRAAWIAALAPTWVAPLGEMQCAPPGWRQDHLPPLGSLLEM
jgi:hypothetical protein